MIWRKDLGKLEAKQAAAEIFRELKLSSRTGFPFVEHRASAALVQLLQPALFPSAEDALIEVRRTLLPRERIELEEFERVIRRRAIRACQAGPVRFVFAALVAIDWSVSLKPVTTNSVRITFPPSMPRWIQERRDQSGISDGTLRSSIAWAARPLLASVVARTHAEAYDLASASVNALRGVWFVALSGATRQRMTFGGVPDPLSPAPLVGLQSVHHKNSRPIEDLFASGDEYRKLTLNQAFKVHAERVQTSAVASLRRLRKSSLGSSTREGIRLYAEALDRANLSDTFLALWPAFERLVGMRVNDSEQALNRASNLYVHRASQLNRLRLLRNARDQLVHHGKTLPDAELCAVELKAHVELLIRYRLALPPAVVDEVEAVDMLDYCHIDSYARAQLVRRLRLSTLAARITSTTKVITRSGHTNVRSQ